MFTLLHVLKNNRPSSYIIELFNRPSTGSGLPFEIYDSKNKVYFYRYLPTGFKTFKVNIPDPGEYHFSADAIVKEKPLIVIPEVFNLRLPANERNRHKRYEIKFDYSRTDTPALIYTFDEKPATIVFGAKYKSLSVPMKIFIGLHELGHLRYKTEMYCDLWASIEFIKMGYNPSTAIYCLTDVLKDSPEKNRRINFVYNEFLKYGIC